MRSAKTLIKLRGYSGCSEYTLIAKVFVVFFCFVFFVKGGGGGDGVWRGRWLILFKLYM